MEKILIVEDDRFFREMYADILRQEGYEVHTADSGESALSTFRIPDFALVITDLIMGEISGLELLTRIKQIDPSVNVIIITGNANIDSAVYALKNGARDYLIKPFNHDEFKHSVALTMEQFRLINENKDLHAMVNLYQKGQAIANCLDLERLYGAIVETLGSQLGVGRGVGLFHDEDGTLVLRYGMGFSDDDAARLAAMVTERLLPAAAEPGRVDVVQWFPADDPLASLQLREAYIFPIRSKLAEQGVVVLFSTGDAVILDTDLHRQSFLLDQSSLAYENASRFSNTRNLIYVDELTGLYNYRYLDVALEREIRRAERYSSPLAVIFIDLDLFKGVNDTFGHLVGSRVLREVGDILRGAVREVDTMIRYGGDEFTVILVETGEKGAAIVSERIRRAIEGYPFSADDGTEIRLTASIGFACYPQDTTSRRDLLEMADKAMYRGKAEGKNIVFRAADLIRAES